MLNLFITDDILIVDNCSSDGTQTACREKLNLVTVDLLEDKNIGECCLGRFSNILTYYVRTNENGGGSLGFHLGCKLAIEYLNSNYVWMMDDDGQPSQNCLEQLTEKLPSDFLSSLVVSEEDEEELAFGFGNITKRQDVRNQDVITGFANPFNSILVSKKALIKSGYPRGDFFIYGDENEFQQRLVKNGFKPILVTSSIHIHPKNRQIKKSFFGMFEYIVISGKLRKYCYFRNTFYVIRNYSSRKQALRWALKNYFISFCKINLADINIIYRAIKESKQEVFVNHRDYL